MWKTWKVCTRLDKGILLRRNFKFFKVDEFLSLLSNIIQDIFLAFIRNLRKYFRLFHTFTNFSTYLYGFPPKIKGSVQYLKNLSNSELLLWKLPIRFYRSFCNSHLYYIKFEMWLFSPHFTVFKESSLFERFKWYFKNITLSNPHFS